MSEAMVNLSLNEYNEIRDKLLKYERIFEELFEVRELADYEATSIGDIYYDQLFTKNTDQMSIETRDYIKGILERKYTDVRALLSSDDRIENPMDLKLTPNSFNIALFKIKREAKNS